VKLFWLEQPRSSGRCLSQNLCGLPRDLACYSSTVAGQSVSHCHYHICLRCCSHITVKAALAVSSLSPPRAVRVCSHSHPSLSAFIHAFFYSQALRRVISTFLRTQPPSSNSKQTLFEKKSTTYVYLRLLVKWRENFLANEALSFFAVCIEEQKARSWIS